ncbi:MAG: hypothetical protein RSB38_00195 [Oscillospiraceae bacterium]
MESRRYKIKAEIQNDFLNNISLYDDLKINQAVRAILKKFYNNYDYNLDELSKAITQKVLALDKSENNDTAILYVQHSDENYNILKSISSITGIDMRLIVEALVYEFNSLSFEERRKLYLL